MNEFLSKTSHVTRVGHDSWLIIGRYAHRRRFRDQNVNEGSMKGHNPPTAAIRAYSRMFYSLGGLLNPFVHCSIPYLSITVCWKSEGRERRVAQASARHYCWETRTIGSVVDVRTQ